MENLKLIRIEILTLQKMPPPLENFPTPGSILTKGAGAVEGAITLLQQGKRGTILLVIFWQKKSCTFESLLLFFL